jgi:hypothetical protein
MKGPSLLSAAGRPGVEWGADGVYHAPHDVDSGANRGPFTPGRYPVTITNSTEPFEWHGEHCGAAKAYHFALVDAARSVGDVTAFPDRAERTL